VLRLDLDAVQLCRQRLGDAQVKGTVPHVDAGGADLVRQAGIPQQIALRVLDQIAAVGELFAFAFVDAGGKQRDVLHVDVAAFEHVELDVDGLRFEQGAGGQRDGGCSDSGKGKRGAQKRTKHGGKVS